MARTLFALAALALGAAASCTKEEPPPVGVTVCNRAHDGTAGEAHLALLVGQEEVASQSLGRLASGECRSVGLQAPGVAEAGVRLRYTPEGGKPTEKAGYVPPGYRMNFEVLGRGVVRAQATRQAQE